MTDLSKSMSISAAGMKVQGERLRVISEDLANAGPTASGFRSHQTSVQPAMTGSTTHSASSDAMRITIFPTRRR